MAIGLTTTDSSRPVRLSRQRSGRLIAGLAGAQGLFYLVTGVWPLVHIDSFQAVTGPKMDLWLVYTVGVLVAVIGAMLLLAARNRSFTPELVLLAAGTATGLAAIDAVFVARGVIDRIYLLDAAVELGLAACWIAVWASKREPTDQA